MEFRCIFFGVMMSINSYGLTWAVLASMGLLMVYLLLQVSLFWLVGQFMSDTLGVQVALSTLMCAGLMMMVVWRLSVSVGRPKEILGINVVFPWVWVGIFGLLLAVFLLISGGLQDFFGRSSSDFMDELLDERSFWLMMVLVLVIAPIYEEWVFRGFVMGVILHAQGQRTIKTFVAIVVSSLAFALVHLQYDWLGLGLIFVLALMLAWARLATRTLYVPMVLHILNNAMAMAEYLLSRDVCSIACRPPVS